MNTFELKCYQEEKKIARRKNKLLPIETRENNSDRYADLLNYENQYALIRK